MIDKTVSGGSVIAAASGDSHSHMRDSEMKGSILKVQRYPEVTFTPQQAEGQRSARGEFPATVRGFLMLHGAAHEITLNTMVRPSGDRFTATTHFTVPYVAWGLKDQHSRFSLRQNGRGRGQHARPCDLGYGRHGRGHADDGPVACKLDRPHSLLASSPFARLCPYE